MSDNKHAEERMELGHEPVPPYRTVFYIAIVAASLYLAVILLRDLFLH